MRKIKVSSVRDVLIILLQLYGSKDKLFEDNLFWVGQCGGGGGGGGGGGSV